MAGGGVAGGALVASPALSAAPPAAMPTQASAQAASAWPSAAPQQVAPPEAFQVYRAAPAQYGASQGMSATSPGYPTYPQGYQGYAQGYAPATPYGYTYGYQYPYPYYYPAYPAQPKKPGETYAKVLSWILVFVSGLAALGGLILVIVSVIVLGGSEGSNLALVAELAGFGLALALGGGFATFYSITGILRRPSPRFSLPPAWVMLALTLAALASGVVFWHLDTVGSFTPGSTLGVLPLAMLCGIAPAFTILAFTSQRLHDPATRRRVWMSLIWGAAGATTLAAILELVLGLIVAVLMHISVNSILSTNFTSGSPGQLLFTLIEISVIAPVVEEGLKPLGALLIMRRLRTPGQAFLVGLAAGIGFDMVETIGYIGMGQADWVYVAIERIGSGLLHGVGAGMTALGWYYLINGKGVRLRWVKGVGCGLYAVIQHAIFNGSNLITSLIPGLSQPLSQPLYLVKLPFESEALVFMVLYAIILAVLIVVTGRIRDDKGMASATPIAPAAVAQTAGGVRA